MVQRPHAPNKRRVWVEGLAPRWTISQGVKVDRQATRQVLARLWLAWRGWLLLKHLKDVNKVVVYLANMVYTIKNFNEHQLLHLESWTDTKIIKYDEDKNKILRNIVNY